MTWLSPIIAGFAGGCTYAALQAWWERHEARRKERVRKESKWTT